MQRRSFITGLSGILLTSQAPAVLSQGSAMKIWVPKQELLNPWRAVEIRVVEILPGNEKFAKFRIMHVNFSADRRAVQDKAFFEKMISLAAKDNGNNNGNGYYIRA